MTRKKIHRKIKMWENWKFKRTKNWINVLEVVANIFHSKAFPSCTPTVKRISNSKLLPLLYLLLPWIPIWIDKL